MAGWQPPSPSASLIPGIARAEERPDAATLYRWLRRAVEEGLLRQDGLGKRKDPFRYWLPASEERWRKDLLALLRMPELFRPPPPEESPGDRGAGWENGS